MEYIEYEQLFLEKKYLSVCFNFHPQKDPAVFLTQKTPENLSESHLSHKPEFNYMLLPNKMMPILQHHRPILIGLFLKKSYKYII